MPESTRWGLAARQKLEHPKPLSVATPGYLGGFCIHPYATLTPCPATNAANPPTTTMASTTAYPAISRNSNAPALRNQRHSKCSTRTTQGCSRSYHEPLKLQSVPIATSPYATRCPIVDASGSALWPIEMAR